jgi:small-conductance mechanosensitive channel
MREAIWDAFKQNEITIAFPQIDVHFDPPVTAGLSRRAA